MYVCNFFLLSLQLRLDYDSQPGMTTNDVWEMEITKT